MTRETDGDASAAEAGDRRIGRLRLAHVRQELLAPVTAIVGYSQMLRESVEETTAEEVREDVARIEASANTLYTAVDQLLDTELARELYAGRDPDDVQRTLRHDLRSPMNAIKGYAELLIEDIDEGASLLTDLESLLNETDRLLSQLNAIVDFSHGQDARVAEESASEASMFADLARSMRPLERDATRIHPGRILVVDDLEANRAFLLRRLQREAHSVEAVASGRAALEAVARREFDLVLLDVMMPGMNGLDVLHALKADARSRDMPVLMVSALEEAESVIRCIEAGAEDYLQKPVDPTLLRARVNACIEKAHLRQEAARLLARLEKEVHEARAHQLNLVPSHFPEPSSACPVAVHAVMEPAREVGGDFYDFFQAGEGSFYAVVGDVADKGVGAGMFMARARSLIRLAALEWLAASGKVLEPDAVLRIVNPELCDSNPDMNFVTVLLARLDLRDGSISYANSGHAPPIRLGSDGIEPLDGARWPPMGIDEDADFGCERLRLSPDEGLYLFTDGVTEATNTDSELYGDERLERCLRAAHGQPPRAVVDAVMANLRAFVGEARPFDDITMLAFRWFG